MSKQHKPDCAVHELSYGVNPCTCGADKPPTQPAPGEVDFALRELKAYAVQHPSHVLADIYSTIIVHITAQARRLAEVEGAYKHVKECLHTFQVRAQRAEERIQELEEQND